MPLSRLEKREGVQRGGTAANVKSLKPFFRKHWSLERASPEGAAKSCCWWQCDAQIEKVEDRNQGPVFRMKRNSHPGQNGKEMSPTLLAWPSQESGLCCDLWAVDSPAALGVGLEEVQDIRVGG